MIRSCEHCGQRFASANLGRPPKFCSVDCRTTAYRRSEGGAKRVESARSVPSARRTARPRCPQCGRAYAQATAGRPRKFCGRACRAKYYRTARGVTFHDDVMAAAVIERAQAAVRGARAKRKNQS